MPVRIFIFGLLIFSAMIHFCESSLADTAAPPYQIASLTSATPGYSRDGDCLDSITQVVAKHAVAPTWDVGIGTAILTRGTLSGSPIINELIPSPQTLLNANQFRFNSSAGPDISALKKLRPDSYFDAIGFRYFDVQSIAAGASTDTSGKAWRFPTDSRGSISNTRDVQSSYISQLYSFEANLYRASENPHLQWLTGFRWIQAADALGLVGTNDPGTQTIGWNWDTANNLYGWQVGAVTSWLPMSSDWSLTCSPKIGIYGNQCLSRWSDGVPAGTISNTNRIFRNQVAFAGDLSASLGYRIGEHCRLSVGYQLLWLNGVGVAGDQVAVLSDDTIATGLNSSGSAFYHGALAGIHFNW
jgi:YD repeat-containing protein